MTALRAVALPLRLSVAAALLVLLVAAQPAQCGPPREAPWSAFTLQGARFGNTAVVAVERGMVAVAAAVPDFIESPRGEPLTASQPEIEKLSVTVSLTIFGGRRVRLENHLWFDPHTDTPLYLVRTRFGLKDYHQRFRFTREGAFRLQREPATAGETAKPPEAWTRIGRHFYPYPADGKLCPDIIESSQLILLAAARAAGPAWGVGPLCVFHKRQAHRVTLQTQPPQEVRFDYLEKRAAGERRRAGTVSAEGLRVASRPIGSYRGDVEDFIRGGARVFLHPAERLPLTVQGQMPLIGAVEMTLQTVEFR
jgi:hypothetical protein